ncbi:hypothetical protein MMC21_002530 [Puttea exsequens]|nr:hypothetical protein [Puttea exsequens]
MSTASITIAGAGLAGLTLGQCLRQKGIPSLVLERVATPPRHNYGITLHPWAYQLLLKALQMDELTFRKNVSVDSSQDGVGSMTGCILSSGVNSSSGTFRCHRGKLEQALREGQDIRWEHAIEDVGASSQKVTIRIHKKQPIESSILVGSDGVHSQVRKSLLPEMPLNILPYVVFNGRRTITLGEYHNTLAPQMDGHSIIETRHNDIVLQIAINEYAKSAVDVSYTYSRPARQRDPLHNPDRPVSGATETPEDFYSELQELEGLAAAFAEIFDPAKVRQDRILHWLMRSALNTDQDVQRLINRGVLLIGDAAHAMPILGGEGANTALKDGADLAEHIAAHGITGFRSFSNVRYDYWKAMVEDSEQRLSRMHLTS